MTSPDMGAPLDPGPRDAGESEQPQAEQILRLVMNEYELLNDGAGKGFARRPGSGVATPIRSRAFTQAVARSFRSETGRVPQPSSLNAAVHGLEAEAVLAHEAESVSLRVALDDGEIVLDLRGNGFVLISADGWEHSGSCRSTFVWPNTSRPLPVPRHGGNIEQLRSFLNLESDDDFILAVAWLVQTLNPSGPYPLAILQGEAGSAKSTTTRLLKSLTDPTHPQVRSAPRSERDLAIAAQANRVLAMDNLSVLPAWLSDALCRTSTGGGIATRALYTDAEEQVFDHVRPVILNGLDAVATRQDLIHRSIILRLPRINPSLRRDESEYWKAFEKARPQLLGCLLDALSAGLRHLEDTCLEGTPRMADFARFVAAAEGSFGWQPGAFMAAYEANTAYALRSSLDGSVVAAAVAELVSGPGSESEWEGTPSQLLEALGATSGAHAARTSRAWPKNAQALSRQLTTLSQALRESGIEIDPGSHGRGSTKTRWVTIREVGRGDGGDA